MHDIALLELARPVDDVTPVELYKYSNEQERVVKIYGKGAAGNDLDGADPKAPDRGDLRRRYNQIVRPDVTLRMLMSHTSGFNVGGFPDFMPQERVPTLIETLDGSRRRNTTPFVSHLFLARVIATRTGESWSNSR